MQLFIDCTHYNRWHAHNYMCRAHLNVSRCDNDHVPNGALERQRRRVSGPRHPAPLLAAAPPCEARFSRTMPQPHAPRPVSQHALRFLCHRSMFVPLCRRGRGRCLVYPSVHRKEDTRGELRCVDDCMGRIKKAPGLLKRLVDRSAGVR